MNHSLTTPEIPPSKIGPEDVARRRAELLLLDVRTPSEFDASHIEGAVLHPLNALNPEAVAALSAGRAGCVIVCGSGIRATQAAQTLRASGHNASVLEGGMAGWEARGLPVRRGSETAWSIERQTRFTIGGIILAGALGGLFVHPAFTWIAAFGGAGLFVSGITNWCGLGLLLAAMPWNKRSCSRCTA